MVVVVVLVMVVIAVAVEEYLCIYLLSWNKIILYVEFSLSIVRSLARSCGGGGSGSNTAATLCRRRRRRCYCDPAASAPPPPPPPVFITLAHSHTREPAFFFPCSLAPFYYISVNNGKLPVRVALRVHPLTAQTGQQMREHTPTPRPRSLVGKLTAKMRMPERLFGANYKYEFLRAHLKTS